MKHELTASRLTSALNNAAISASELSVASKVSEASISQYVNGSHKPSNLSSGKMAKVLGVDPLWLMGFDVPMMKSENDIPVYDPDIQEIVDLLSRITPEQKQTILNLLRSFVPKN